MMNQSIVTTMHRFGFLIVIVLLSACGGTANKTGMTPLPSLDPNDEVLFEEVTNFVSQKGAPPNSVYDHVRVDLNGDGLRDALVLFKLPHTYWCGWDGCGLAVFKASPNKFSFMSQINGVRGPLYVSRTGNDGWRDIILRLSGTNMRDKNILMAYNGASYPSTPLLAPTYYRPIDNSYKVFFK